MRLAVTPAGATTWSNDLTVLRLEGSGTIHAERLQVSLDQSEPAAEPMDLRFFNDAPGWFPQPTNRHHPEILVGARASALDAIPSRHGPFLDIEVLTLSWNDLDHAGPRLAFPSFGATDP
jgi:hypothetical protein